MCGKITRGNLVYGGTHPAPRKAELPPCMQPDCTQGKGSCWTEVAATDRLEVYASFLHSG